MSLLRLLRKSLLQIQSCLRLRDLFSVPGVGLQMPVGPSCLVHSLPALSGHCALTKITDFITNPENGNCLPSQSSSKSPGCRLNLGFGAGLGWKRHCPLMKMDLILKRKGREKKEGGKQVFLPSLSQTAHLQYKSSWGICL